MAYCFVLFKVEGVFVVTKCEEELFFLIRLNMINLGKSGL